jgi:hypothetical protein
MRFTYRNHFEPIVGNVTTDSGWGCTGRSAQMLLANCILRSHFEFSTEDEDGCMKVLSHFRDKATAAFSIHAITSTSMSLFGKLPTEWLVRHTHFSLSFLSVSQSPLRPGAFIRQPDRRVACQSTRIAAIAVSSCYGSFRCHGRCR